MHSSKILYAVAGETNADKKEWRLKQILCEAQRDKCSLSHKSFQVCIMNSVVNRINISYSCESYKIF